ncbi:MAG TPA: FHA domain-containing protein [Planctomycetota bacterium]|nr:FHA domain-containing protein [Planctomycetota bacterium]
MTDDRLREAERVYQETGSVSAETRLLTERVRAGILPAERLELAAALHDVAACSALGRPATARTHDLRVLFEELERFGREALVRAALVIARRCSARDWRTARPIRAVVDTRTCLAEIEAWLACPCRSHALLVQTAATRRPHPDGVIAARIVLGLGRFGDLHRLIDEDLGLYPPHLPDPPLAAAVRRELAAWAKGLPPPPVTPSGTPGSLLELRVGRRREDATSRVLLARETTRVGADEDALVHLDDPVNDRCEIVRAGTGYEVRPVGGTSATFLNDTPLAARPLATSDVITIGDVWLEVTVHGEPLPREIAEARSAAARLGATVPDDERRRRIEVAAACDHLAATLAASDAGFVLRPRFDEHAWLRALPEVPELPAAAATLALARELRPRWTEIAPEDAVLERALVALEKWVKTRFRDDRDRARALARELGVVLDAKRRELGGQSSTPSPPAAAADPFDYAGITAGHVALLGLSAIDRGGALVDAALAALEIGTDAARVRALVSGELLRWALGEEDRVPDPG